MKKLKKNIKKMVGRSGYDTLASFYHKTRPAQETDKPVAFLFGFSKWKHQHMKDYLQDYIVKFMDERHSTRYQLSLMDHYLDKVIMVWGYEESEQIKSYAKEKGIPFYRIEDGFIRSVQLGADKAVPLSLCIDSQALYYDATNPSDLEDLLNTYPFKEDRELITRAQQCMERLLELHLSKYNLVSEKDVQKIYGEKTKKRILVIGQVEDDKSIELGCAVKMTNNDLVRLAANENPEAEIIYKPHPDVLFQKRAMQSDPKEVEDIATVITEPLSLADAFETIDHVYTITSLAGFEALMRGIPVTTVGAPFYSGWGLTDDRQKVTRRARTLTVEEVFAAAYILYPKYMHPETAVPIQIEEAIELLAEMRKENSSNTSSRKSEFWDIPGEAHARIGILSKGIQEIPNLDSFLRGTAVFQPVDGREVDLIAGWGKKPSAEKAQAFSQKYSIPYISLEDGFIRSLGLGVEGSPPLSLCIDHIGIYYDATRPSRLEYILNQQGWEDETLLRLARSAMDFIVKHQISKYNHAPPISDEYFKKVGEERILVVDQTRGDMSITLGLADKERFQEMYREARRDHPNAHIFIKTHPDVISGKKQGNLTDTEIDDETTVLYDDCNPLSLLKQVQKVYVVTSQLGFEALMLKKDVYCYGMPFYAGWGLTHDKLSCERRKTKRTLEEIFAAAYFIYPRYLHPLTKEPGTIFDVIHYIAEQRASSC